MDEDKNFYLHFGYLLLHATPRALGRYVDRNYPGGIHKAVQDNRDDLSDRLSTRQWKEFKRYIETNYNPFGQLRDELLESTILDKEVLDLLISRFHLDVEDRKVVESYARQTDRNRSVIDLMINRGLNVVVLLTKVLKELNEAPDLVRKMETDLHQYTPQQISIAHQTIRGTQRLRIQKCYHKVVNNLGSTETVVDNLITRAILTIEDSEEILQPSLTRADKNRKLIEKLRSEQACDAFLQAIEKDAVDNNLSQEIRNTNGSDLQTEEKENKEPNQRLHLGLLPILELMSLTKRNLKQFNENPNAESLGRSIQQSTDPEANEGTVAHTGLESSAKHSLHRRNLDKVESLEIEVNRLRNMYCMMVTSECQMTEIEYNECRYTIEEYLFSSTSHACSTLFALEASTLRTNSNNDNKRRSKTQQIRNIKEENKRQQYFGRIKNDRGDYNPMEYRQIPDLILHEMDKGKAIPERSYKPYLTPYLQQQRDRVKDVIHIINPYHPDLADLVVKGEGCNGVSFHDNNKDDLGTYKIMDIPPSLSPVCEVSEGNIDLEKPEMEGPALMVGHVKLTWKDRTTSPLIPVSIAFEAHQGYVQTKHISLKNCGSTVLHFYLEPVPMKNPFGLRKRKRQVFYFATEGKTLAPGDEVSIPVIYKSDFPGTFKSIWKLKTTPVLCNGADVLVKLKASTAIQQLSEDRIDSIQKIIEEQQKTCVVEETLNGILRQMHTPPRDLTPVETDRVTEIIPIDVYPGLSRMEQRMKDLYDDICRNDFATHAHPEFSINNLSNIICSLDSLETPLPDTPDYQTVLDTMNSRRHTLNTEFYNLTKEISFGTVFPLQNTTIRRMHLSTQILQATVEQFAESSCTIAYRMGIPVLPIQSEECQVENVQFQRKRKQSLAVKPCKKELESKAGASHTQAVSKGAKNKKKGAQSPPKVAPPPPKPEPEVQQVEIFSPVVKEKASTTQLQYFREKLYIQAYGLLQEAIDAMDTFFGEI